MNIGFYDPISERWIKPRPPKEPEEKPSVSLGEALLNAVEAAALKERNDKIWQYLKQSAEGCNSAPVAAPIVTGEPAEYDPVSMQWDDRPIVEQIAEIWGTRRAPIVTVANLPDFEAVESLGYIYWKPKDAQCSGQQE